MNKKEFVSAMQMNGKILREELGPDFPSQYMTVFFDIAAHPESSISEIGGRLEMTTSSVSRAVAALSTWSWTKKKGQGLVEKTIDPYESRRKNVKLSMHGEDLLRRLVSTVEKYEASN